MESADSDTEGESREKPHPVPPSVQEGSSNLLCEKRGMKSAAPKSNKQQPLCTDHLTDTVLASQGACDTSSSLGWVRSDPSTAYDSNSWEILSTNSEEEKPQAHKTSAELLGDHRAGQKSSPKSRDDTSARANEILGHQRREEPVEQRNYNRRDDHESKENLGPNSRTGRNDAEDTPLPAAAARGWEKCICLENPYLSSERLRTEETMTLDFVAVMSKKSKFSEESSKICVAFYKQPGQYQEFAVLKKRKNLIVGRATIPISDLQRGPIFYKYAVLNNVLSTDAEMRLWDLEHIYGMDSKNIESQLHRVINIPKEEIKADGTWTIFESMKCYFHEKKKNYFKYLPSFKFWSSTTMPQKSVNRGIVEYLADEFLRSISLQKGFKDTERKLKIYTESFKIYLGDAAKGELYSPTNLSEPVLYENMIKFMDKIIGYLETEKHKDDGLLFALYTSFWYNIPLSKEVIVKAEKLLQDIGPFQGKFKHLRGKSNYISAVKEICLSNKGNTLWIWLIPLLYAITEKMEDPFFPQTIPLQHLLQLRNDEEKQREVLAMIEVHKSFIESCCPLAKTVLEMLALKNFTKDSLLQIKLPPQLLLDTVYQRIVKVICKPSQVHEKDLNGVLNNIAERMAFWFKDLCLPRGTEQMTEDALPCLNSTYALLVFSLKHWHAVPFSLIMSLLRILNMFAAKSDVLQANQEFQQFISERFNEFAGYIKEWLEKSLPRPPMENRQFLENIHVFHELFLLEILCVEWTQKWQSLIYSIVERWLEKVEGRKLLDFYLEFMKKEKCWNTNLESCFTDCVIQRIKYFEKSEEPMLGKMVSKVLKTDRSTVGKVLSAVVEKIFSDKMRTLEKVDRFVDNTGPVLAEVLSSSVIYDLLSAVREFPTQWLFLNPWFGSEL